MLELQLLVEDERKDEPTAKPKWQEPRRVGRTLRAEKLADPNAWDEQFWLQGEQTRVVMLDPGFVVATLNDFELQGVDYASIVRRPLEFRHDQPCDVCSYQDACTMRARKQKRQDDH